MAKRATADPSPDDAEPSVQAAARRVRLRQIAPNLIGTLITGRQTAYEVLHPPKPAKPNGKAAKLPQPDPPGTRLMNGTWADPDDMGRFGREPRKIKGQRRYCPLRSMANRRGAQITPRQLHAAELARTLHENAALGPSAVPGEGRAAPGPRFGPPNTALAQAAESRRFARLLKFIGQTRKPMFLWFIIERRDLKAWVKAVESVTRRRADPKSEMGKLLGILDTLADYFAFEIDAANEFDDAPV